MNTTELFKSSISHNTAIAPESNYLALKPQGIINPEIISARLEYLTGMKFTVTDVHIKPQTLVNEQMSLRVKRSLNADVNVVSRQAGIDKADYLLYEMVSIEDMKKRAETLGLPWKYQKIGENRQQVLTIGDPKGEHIHLAIRHIRSLNTRRVLTNPNKFRSAKRYFLFLVVFFGLNHFEYMKLFRLDFNVDLEEDFDAVRKMIRVKYKQLNERCKSRSSHITGLYFGGGNERLCAYNKSFQLSTKGVKSSRSVSRLETRLLRKKIPVVHAYELPMLIKNTKHGRPVNPFHWIYLEPFILADESTVSGQKLVRLIRLKELIEANGLDNAIRKLNKNGNFFRDYKGLIEFQESPYDLNEILLSNLADFFGKRRPVYL